jgi:hypothetical protein
MFRLTICGLSIPELRRKQAVPPVEFDSPRTLQDSERLTLVAVAVEEAAVVLETVVAVRFSNS